MKNVKNVTVKELNAMSSDDLLAYATSLDHNAIIGLSEEMFNVLFTNVQIETVSITSNRKASLYKYPNNINDTDNKHEKQGLMKQHRQKLRKELDRFVKGFILNQSIIQKIKFIKDNNFISKYKESYLLNDYSVESVCASHKDNESKKNISLFMQFVRDYKSKL